MHLNGSNGGISVHPCIRCTRVYREEYPHQCDALYSGSMLHSKEGDLNGSNGGTISASCIRCTRVYREEYASISVMHLHGSMLPAKAGHLKDQM